MIIIIDGAALEAALVCSVIAVWLGAVITWVCDMDNSPIAGAIYGWGLAAFTVLGIAGAVWDAV
jgi:hypothetical protein